MQPDAAGCVGRVHVKQYNEDMLVLQSAVDEVEANFKRSQDDVLLRMVSKHMPIPTAVIVVYGTPRVPSVRTSICSFPSTNTVTTSTQRAIANMPREEFSATVASFFA
jgi:hypothetical protein